MAGIDLWVDRTDYGPATGPRPWDGEGAARLYVARMTGLSRAQSIWRSTPKMQQETAPSAGDETQRLTVAPKDKIPEGVGNDGSTAPTSVPPSLKTENEKSTLLSPCLPQSGLVLR